MFFGYPRVPRSRIRRLSVAPASSDYENDKRERLPSAARPHAVSAGGIEPTRHASAATNSYRRSLVPMHVSVALPSQSNRRAASRAQEMIHRRHRAGHGMTTSGFAGSLLMGSERWQRTLLRRCCPRHGHDYAFALPATASFSSTEADSNARAATTSATTSASGSSSSAAAASSRVSAAIVLGASKLET
jgi:hypothetical protein